MNEKISNQIFAKRVKEIRESAGWTKVQLCQITNKSYATVSNWEKGTQLPSNAAEILNLLEQRSKGPEISSATFKKVNTPDKDFIEFVYNMRTAARFSIAELADHIGEKTSHLAYLEEGTQEPINKEEFVKKIRRIVKDEIQNRHERGQK